MARSEEVPLRRSTQGRRGTAPVWLILVHVAALMPALMLGLAIASNALGPDPVGSATRRTGRYAIVLLLLTLSLTPLARFTRLRTRRLRRPLGLYAFGYAALHLGIYLGWDYGFAWGYALQSIRSSPFIWAGGASLLILLILAVTSTRAWQKRLGRRWKALHRLVYLAGALAGWHYAWVFKELRVLPMVYLGAVALLLAVRIPAIGRRLGIGKSST